jgi:hypothetical protein
MFHCKSKGTYEPILWARPGESCEAEKDKNYFPCQTIKMKRAVTDFKQAQSKDLSAPELNLGAFSVSTFNRNQQSVDAAVPYYRQNC